MPVYPYLVVVDAPAALQFYEQVFGADVFHVVKDNEGKIVHARFRVEGAVVMVHEYTPGELPGVKAPSEASCTTVSVRFELSSRAHVDEIFARAGMSDSVQIVAPPSVASWGEYYGRLIDPFGHAWAFGAEGADIS